MNQAVRFDNITGFKVVPTCRGSREQRHLFLAVILPFASVLMVPANVAPAWQISRAQCEQIIALQERQRRLGEVLAQGLAPDDFQIVPYAGESDKTHHQPLFNAFTDMSSLELSSLPSLELITEDSHRFKSSSDYNSNLPKRGPPSCMLT